LDVSVADVGPRLGFPRYKLRESERLGFGSHELVRTRLRRRRVRFGAS
jgi:hypothetical protein